MGGKKLNTYKANMPRVFDSVRSVLGINVMLIVLESALYKIRNQYPEASAIHFSENGIVLDEIEKLPTDKAIIIIEGFMQSVIDTMARLMGKKKVEAAAFQLKLDDQFASL